MNTQAVKILLRAGANPHALDENGLTPFQVADKCRHSGAVVDLLRKAMENPRRTQITPHAPTVLTLPMQHVRNLKKTLDQYALDDDPVEFGRSR